ncbi:MAG: L,D-transpeptidase [Chloroflexota bacterium]
MSKSSASTQRSRLYPALLLLLASGVLGFSAWSAASSPVLASYLSPSPAPVVHLQSYAVMQIAKPTYTAETSPLPTPTLVSPQIIPTEFAEVTPESGLIQAVIVPDTPAPDAQYNSSSAPDSPAYAGNKYILVSISEQHLYAYEGDTLVYSFVASTGINNGTRVGTFSVLEKIPNAYGSTWDIWMPNWLGIYWSGGLQNGIHALPILPSGATLWEGYLGTPISYGCVVLGTYESQLLYDWAETGTPVEIRW